MPTLKEFQFLSTDQKTQIYVRGYVPDVAVKGTVQIAHGVAEYINRYDGFMQYLAENGYAAFGNDHLGHGQSVTGEENRGFFAEENGWQAVVGDMKKLRDRIKEAYPAQKAVLFGHSMGSFLSRTYIIDHPDDFDAAVICGTGQQSGLLVSLGAMAAKGECRKNGPKFHSEKLQKLAFGGYNKAFEPVRTPVDWLSRSTENVDRYIADPLCGFTPSAGLFRDMMSGIQYISRKENVAKVRKDLPILLIAGALDPVGESGRGVRKACAMYQAAGIRDVSMRLYENDRHEILNETDAAQVYRDVLQWINAHNRA